MTIGPGSLVNGKYRLGRQLGEGGMGSIFEARHEFLGTEVALKFLHPALSSRASVVARFVQEARVSANIRSPHVVQVIDVDQSPEGLAFLVMELLHGEPLSSRLAREPVLALPLVVSIALQVLLALEAAHALGVVHRDMKPENVFLTDSPGTAGATSDGLLVKILDFGIAKLRTLGEVRAQLTRPGMVMGTPEYMAPEQVFSADAVDARADLYALGAMCFEMLAGRRPIEADDARAVAAKVMQGQTPRLEQLAPSVPSSIADVVAIALSSKPSDRFSSATAMRQALVHAAREANVNIDAPPAALRSRVNLSTDASGAFGGVGLGVAPPAMLGPGNPASMVAFDARDRQSPKPAELQARTPSASGHPAVNGGSTVASPPIPLPPSPAHGVSEADHRVASQGALLHHERSYDDGPARDGGTLAAMPSPYAPPYGYSESTGSTDQGFVPPYATDPNFGQTSRSTSPPDGVTPNAMSTPGGPVYTPPYTQSIDRSRRGVPWLPIGLGVLGLGAVVALIVWAVQPTPVPPAPVPAASVEPEEEEETPKKKKPKPAPSEAPSVAPTVAPTPIATTPKPPPKVDAGPKPLPSTSTSAPVPSATASTPKPQPSTLPPDIIPLPPIQWPPPGLP